MGDSCLVMKMKIMTKKGMLLNQHGIIVASNLTVQRDATMCVIGGTPHLREDLAFFNRQISPKVVVGHKSQWTLVW